MFSPFSWTKVASSSWHSREVSTNLDLSTAINDEGKFLLAARRCRHATCTDYIVSLNAEDVSKGSSTYIGKLRLAMLSIFAFSRLFCTEVLTYSIFIADLTFWELNSQSMMHSLQVPELEWENAVPLD